MEEFKDRKARYPNRVKITPESGGEAFFATMVRADEPTEEGTALNAAIFNEMVAMIQGIALDATVE